MSETIRINHQSSLPKYYQIVDSIIRSIEQGELSPGDQLPSITDVSIKYDIGKTTVEQAYNTLKQKGLVKSVQGKGFYITHNNLNKNQKVFLLFNKLSTHKKIIYDAFVEQLGPQVHIDFFIYNNDYTLFKSLLSRYKGDYTHYVIIPHFYAEPQQLSEIIQQIPREKLIILDKRLEVLPGNYSYVIQHFEQDLFRSLSEAITPLKKYDTLNILFPSNNYYSKDILKGFYHFCYEHNFGANVITDVQTLHVKPGNVYITIEEEDLVNLIKLVKAAGYKVGQEVGIISYNETPLKEVLLDGITVISTDFYAMGKEAANIILFRERRQVENPFKLILRASL